MKNTVPHETPGNVVSLPLKGVRVIDLGRIYAGPMTTKVLGDMGAEVIKVESIQRIDLPNRKLCYPENEPGDDSYNRGGWFHWLNTNKRSVTIDLNKPKGVEVFKNLVEVSDVVLENFSPRVMKNFGLDYEVLKKVKSDIIMVSLSGFGHSGPYRDRAAYAWAFEGASGLQSLTGYAGGPPMMVGTGYGDWVLGMNGVAAVLMALLHRRKTGKGQYINVSGQEVVLHHIGEAILDYKMTGRVGKPVGNRHDSTALHGCYQCKGDDKWVAIAIRTDSEWKSFCEAIEKPPWTEDKRYSDTSGRRQNQDELDRLIEEWTIQFDHYEVMHRLQRAGVPAGAVLSPKEVLFDVHFRERGFFPIIDHPGAGKRPMPKLMAAKFSQFESPETPAPRLGEHNHEVLEGILGMSRQETEELQKEKVIGSIPIAHGEIEDRGLNIPFIARSGSASFEANYLEQLRKFYNIGGGPGGTDKPENRTETINPKNTE